MTDVEEPFNRSKPSPILAVMSRLSSATESVVVAGKVSQQQSRVAIDDGVQSRIERRIEQGGLDLVVISGSAGDGKSFILGQLLKAPGNRWATYPHRVIEDATHSETPEQSQRDRLKDFFSPLASGQPLTDGPPLIIAMNTGMVIRFFNDLRKDGEFKPYQHIAAALFRALRIPDPESRAPESPAESRILVVNLDDRPTTGAEQSFFTEVLSAFDPNNASGVMMGAERCRSCTVRAWCWVRSNAEIVSSENGRRSLGALAAEIALARGRSINPRALWDAAAVVTLGAATFSHEDPCDDIVDACADEDWQRLWNHSLPNGIFQEAELLGLPTKSASATKFSDFTQELKDRDPTFRADKEVHDLIAQAGIDRKQDALALLEALGDLEGESRLVIGTLVRGLETGVLVSRIGERQGLRNLPRALARARWLSGVSFGIDVDLARFADALRQYAQSGSGPEIDEIEEEVGEALARSFGEAIGGETFFRTGRADGRDVAVYARVDFASGRSHQLLDDNVTLNNPVGSAIAGYKPLTFLMRIGEEEVVLNFELYRLLREACRGKLPSAGELERFYSLGRAVSALGNLAAQDLSNPIVIADYREGDRRVRIEMNERRGSRRFKEREVYP
jgi:hypothetical protein